MIFSICSVILYTLKLDANSDSFASSALVVLRPIPLKLNIDADFVYTCDLDADSNSFMPLTMTDLRPIDPLL